MKNMKLLSILMLFVLSIALNACKGEKGDVGPAGTSGTNGTNGNANVKSVNVTVAPVNWLPNTPNSATGYFYNVPLNEITADIVNRGAVLGYMQATNGAWLALPWTDFYSNFSQVFNYTYNTAFFQPQIKDSDLRSVRPTTDRVYKVVIIAPSGLVGGVNTADYLAVRRAYNLDAVEAAQKERGEVAELGSK